MAFKYHSCLYGPTPPFVEGEAGGTIVEGDLLKKDTDAQVIRCVAVTEDPLFVAMNSASSGEDVLMIPWLPGFVFEVPSEGTAYTDATHKYTKCDLYENGTDNILDSVQPGATTYSSVLILGLKEGETDAEAGNIILVTPCHPFLGADS